MVQFNIEEYLSATTNTIEAAQRLIEAGFEYVTELDGISCLESESDSACTKIILTSCSV